MNYFEPYIEESADGRYRIVKKTIFGEMWLGNNFITWGMRPEHMITEEYIAKILIKEACWVSRSAYAFDFYSLEYSRDMYKIYTDEQERLKGYPKKHSLKGNTDESYS